MKSYNVIAKPFERREHSFAICRKIKSVTFVCGHKHAVNGYIAVCFKLDNKPSNLSIIVQDSKDMPCSMPSKEAIVF